MSIVLDLDMTKITCLSKADNGNQANNNPQTKTEILQLLLLTQFLDKRLDESNGEVARHAKEGYAFVRLPMCHYLHVLDLYRYAECQPKRKDGTAILHTINDIMVVRIRKQEYTLFLSAREDLKTGNWSSECLSVEKCDRAQWKKFDTEVAALAVGYVPQLKPKAQPNPINVPATGKSVKRYPNASGRVASEDYQNGNGGTASGSFASPVAIVCMGSPAQWSWRVRTRSTHPVAALALAFTPSPSVAAPGERRRRLVPVAGDGLEPGDDLIGVLRMLARQGPPLQNPLDAFRHVQPRAA